MNEQQIQKLREPFPPEQIGKLPRVTCRACSENKQQKHCEKHSRSECKVCGAYITTAHMHLDYVGHAIVTARLLDVDPEWFWEPAAVGANGEPLSTDGGFWIRLTVAGVTRYGWGDGPDPKQRISDAIRNAAMRFGVALDLWSKEDLHASGGEPSGAIDPPPDRSSRRAKPAGAASPPEPSPAPPAATGTGAVEPLVADPAPAPETSSFAGKIPASSPKQHAALKAVYKVLRDRGAMNDTQLAASLPDGKATFAALNVVEAGELLTRLENLERNTHVEKVA